MVRSVSLLNTLCRYFFVYFFDQCVLIYLTKYAKIKA